MKRTALVVVVVVVGSAFGCGAKAEETASSRPVASASASAPVVAATSASARRGLGPETNARMSLSARCADCPSFVVTVDRSGAMAFEGERRVRMTHANAQLGSDATKALFQYVVPSVFVDREGAEPEPTPNKTITLRFEDGAGTATLPADTPCTPPTGRYDRHAAPSARCELEHALRDVARPFTYCGPKGCPDKPDPNAKPADFGDVTIGCKPACSRALLDGRPLGKTPTTRRLTPGLHELELERPGSPVQRQKTSVRVEAGQHTNVLVDMSRPTMKVELERAMGQVVEQMLGLR